MAIKVCHVAALSAKFQMVSRRRGSIINMASVASSARGVPKRFAYGTTKAAVVGMTKSLAVDLVSHGIRVNCVLPGTVETPSWWDRVREHPDPEAARRDFVARQKMGRLGTPEEIAGIVTYLAADEVRRRRRRRRRRRIKVY